MDKNEIYDRLSTLSEREAEALYWYFKHGTKQDLIADEMRILPHRQEGYKEHRPSASAARTLYESALAAIRPSPRSTYTIEDVKNYLFEVLGEDNPDWERWPLTPPKPVANEVIEESPSESDNDAHTHFESTIDEREPIPANEGSEPQAINQILTRNNIIVGVFALAILFGLFLFASGWNPFVGFSTGQN